MEALAAIEKEKLQKEAEKMSVMESEKEPMVQPEPAGRSPQAQWALEQWLDWKQQQEPAKEQVQRHQQRQQYQQLLPSIGKKGL